ncbi:DUF1444 family protein [Paraglaciecola sp. 2405UD69-4]|uniref:DUF1444 family protein n=1 Tax=Paraglaciecola sp. 2405UD69-4 TaxID=3391836 RepID=UPI0039C8DBBD
MKLISFLMVSLFSFVSFNTFADGTEVVKDKSNLMLVVRTSYGENKSDANLKPSGEGSFIDSSGKTHTFELAHYEYLGDTHIRFVFDSTATMTNTTAGEFQELGLTPEKAVELAIANIYRDYGQPNIYKLEGGVFQVQGDSPDFDSSYFLDQLLWESVASHFQEKIIVSVPARSILLFAPISDKKAVEFLKENVQVLFEDSGRHGVSSALYSFNNGKWTVFKKAQ